MIFPTNDFLPKLCRPAISPTGGWPTAVFLAPRLQRPLLLEGEPGVGKIELAKAPSTALQPRASRSARQSHDGLEQRQALYEWNYAAQLLHMRAASATGAARDVVLEVYQPHYLIRRPLLQAAARAAARRCAADRTRWSRADEPFEAFLLEPTKASTR